MAIASLIEEQYDDFELIQNPYIELAFPVMGQSLPIDHGYQLYSALKHCLMQLKDWDDVSIKTISGKLDLASRGGKANRDTRNQLNLTERSKLLIRLPSEKVPYIYSFGGKSLIIGKHKIRLGIPEMNFLQPKSRLRSLFCPNC